MISALGRTPKDVLEEKKRNTEKELTKVIQKTFQNYVK